MEHKSLEYFINTVIANHGDIYSFEKTVFKGSDKNVILTCKKHKCDIEIKAMTLLRRTQRNGGNKKDPIVGSCPVCREEYFEQIKNKMYQKFKAVHNNEYKYEDYVNINKPFYAICKIHGKFLITAGNHMSGNGKCSLCVMDAQIIKTINNVRYYNCTVHGNIPIGKKRSKGDGCPKCNLEKQENLNRNALLNRLNREYGENYNIIIDNINIVFICKKHGTSKIVSRKEMRNSKDKVYFCDTCRLEKNIRTSDEAKIFMKTKAREIINNEYKNIYEYLEFIDCGNTEKCKVKLYNVLLEKERIVNAKTILDGELSKKIMMF